MSLYRVSGKWNRGNTPDIRGNSGEVLAEAAAQEADPAEGMYPQMQVQE